MHIINYLIKFCKYCFHFLTVTSDVGIMHFYIFTRKNEHFSINSNCVSRYYFGYLIIMPNGLSFQFSSVAQSCPTLWDPMNCSTPGFTVHHQLPEFTQTHAHLVGDAIQPFHPLSSPSPPAPNASQHQGLFQWVNSSHEVAKVLEFQLQHQSFQWTPRTYVLQDGLVGSPCSPRDSQESSPTP